MKKATKPSTTQQAVAPPDWPTLGLWPSTEPALDELRHRLQQAGCVFDIAVCQLHDGVLVNEALHRHALWALHAQIERRRAAQ